MPWLQKGKKDKGKKDKGKKGKKGAEDPEAEERAAAALAAARAAAIQDAPSQRVTIGTDGVVEAAGANVLTYQGHIEHEALFEDPVIEAQALKRALADGQAALAAADAESGTSPDDADGVDESRHPVEVAFRTAMAQARAVEAASRAHARKLQTAYLRAWREREAAVLAEEWGAREAHRQELEAAVMAQLKEEARAKAQAELDARIAAEAAEADA